MSQRALRAVAATHAQAGRRWQWMAGAAAGLGALFAAVGIAKADSHEKIIVTHGYNEYDDLKYGPDAEHLEYVNPAAPTGGEISIGAIGTFDSMNPYATGIGSWGALATIGYEDIMQATADEVGSVYCVLCDTIEYPESQDWLIINLRDDVMFSDGTPMTAEDVKFTMELFLEQGTPSYRLGVSAMLDSIEVLDPQRVKFNFAADYPRKGLISQMGSISPFSKAWFEETGARLDESRLEIPPGTGEYMLDSLDVGRQIVYKRNPDYWGADHWMMRGRGNYDAIRVEYFGDSSAALEAFKAGIYTVRLENSSLNWATLYDFPAIDNGWVKKETLPDGSLPGASGFAFNMLRDKFQDHNVRLALGRMFNFTWTNQSLQYGLFEQREAVWENERLKATGLPEGEELALLEEFRDQLPEEIFTEPAFLPHESGERALDRRNLRAALALMAEAGYVTGDDGLLRNAEGQTLDVEFLEDTQSFDRILLPYVENLKALGVNVTYNRIDPSQFQNRRLENDFDMRVAGYSAGLIEGSGLSQRYSCEDREDVFNSANYCNPVVDALAERILEIETYDEMATIIRAVDRILRYDYFMVPIWMLRDHWIAYYDMYEYPENLPPFDLGYLDFWWYNVEKGDALRAARALR